MWNLRKNEFIDTENKLVVTKGGRVQGKMGEGGQKVRTSSYKSWDVMYSMMTS